MGKIMLDFFGEADIINNVVDKFIGSNDSSRTPSGEMAELAEGARLEIA